MTVSTVAKCLRWFTRIVSLAFVAGISAMFISKYPVPFDNLSALGFKSGLAFGGLILVAVGFLVAWRWELLGGITSILGVAFLWRTRTDSTITGFFLLLAFIGMLFVASHFLRPKAKSVILMKAG